MTAILNLDTLHLAAGAHDDRYEGVCLLEAVAWFAGREHTDAPPCVSPVLQDYGTRLNDLLDGDHRQQLKQFIPRLVGTADDGKDDTRRWLTVDWLIRVYAPALLGLVPALAADAATLTAIPPVNSPAALASVSDLLAGIARRARDACDAVDVDWDARGAAAVIGIPAKKAVTYPAWDASHAGTDAAGVAGYTAVQPTLDILRTSAVDLFDRLITGDPA